MVNKNPLQKVIITLTFLVVSVAVSSQNVYRLSAGARQVGLSYATVTTSGFWSSFHNQASLGEIDRFSIGINQDNRFGISELSNKTFAFILPKGNGALGAVYSYYGYSEYNRHTAGLSYGMKLGQKLSVGIQADLFSTRGAGDYQNTNELTFETGLLFKPAENLRIGLHVFNPLPNTLRDHDLPTVVKLGTGYYFSSQFMACVELEAGNSVQTVLRVGSEYEILNNFFVRGGFMSNPIGYSFGFGYSGSFLRGDLGFITHENLGLSPSLSIVILLR
ncbi:MAG: hypothetical protein K8R35_07045 [Bacteroidales bacterium]|nr:hypothetical protein [Bacteroidales bacterium]